MKTRHFKLLCLLLETTGIVALFLPFTHDVSPWRVLVNFVEGIGRIGSDWELWPYALPFALALFVWLQTLRSLFPKPLTRLELWLGVALVVVLALVPLARLAWFTVFHASDIRPAEWGFLSLLFGLTLLAAGVLLILRPKGVAFAYLAPLLLRSAYVPNAVFCLAYFAYFESGYFDLWYLQAGAALVATTVTLYLAEIVYLTIQGLKARFAAGLSTAIQA